MCEEQIGIAMMERKPEAIVSELFSSVCAEIRDEVKSHSFSICILFIQNCNVMFHVYARILTARSLLATLFKESKWCQQISFSEIPQNQNSCSIMHVIGPTK